MPSAQEQAQVQEQTQVQEEQTTADVRFFTDSTGREGEVPAVIDRVAVSGPLAQMVVFSLAPETLIGLARPFEEQAFSYVDPSYEALPVLGQLYGSKGELNLEELLRVDPQVVIDIGEPKEGIGQDMDDLQEQTGIPFVHISTTLDSLPEAYTLLGELLGKEEDASKRAAYCARAIEEANALAQKVEKKQVLLLAGEDGLGAIAQGSYHARVVDILAENAAKVAEPSSKGTGNQVDMEQLLQWNPEVILFSPESGYATVATQREWQELAAIKEGHYYEVPYGPDNWMGFPPSVQRILGLQWLSVLLYPEEVSFDLQERVAEYYRLFYHCELSDAQYHALVKNSLPDMQGE